MIEFIFFKYTNYIPSKMNSLIIEKKTEKYEYNYNGINGLRIDKTKSTFIPDLGTTKNVIIVGKVQSGKTAYIINLINETLNNHKVPILIASDRLGVLDQYKTRFSKELSKLLKEVDSSTNINYNYKKSIVYISILSLVRLKKIKEIIYHGGMNFKKEFVLIVDEGDLSVKNISSALEKIQRKMDNFGIFLKRIFITATPFAVSNSKAISSDIEEYIIIPPYKENFVYRDYTNMDIKYTKNIKKISSDELDIKKIASFFKKEIIDTKLSDTQPNIGLLKIFHNNNDKHAFAKKLNKHLKNLNIIVYTGKGSVLYVNKTEKIIEKQGYCIAQSIQKLKNENNTKPILIISYNMASRSQTFKSIDHQWILTHFFIDLPNNSSIEQTLQALRCNGQYKLNDPLIKVYVSRKTDDRIMKLLYNNDVYINACNNKHAENNNINMRDCLRDVNFLKVQNFKMCSRKGIDDTKVVKSSHGICRNYNDAINTAKILIEKNNCSAYEYITDIDLIMPCHLIVAEISKHNKYNPNDSENIYTKLKNLFESNHKSFKGLSAKQQNLLRKIITNYVKEFKNTDNSCQIGYYEERTKTLNKINHLKHDEYKAQIVCELRNNGDASIMIYKKNYYKHPEKFNNKVLIWRNTNGDYHLYVNKENPKYTYISLKNI